MQVSSLAFDPRSGLRFPATLETSPDLLFWLEPKYLLPYTEFLHRSPATNYWKLIFKRAVLNEDPAQFIRNPPLAQSLGPFPFRFESYGEVVHYLEVTELDPDKFQIAHVCDLQLNDRKE